MRSLMFLPCVALLVAAAPASANPPKVSSQIAATDASQPGALPDGGGIADKAASKDDKKICRRLPTTGSRLPNRACLTEKEWKQVQDDLSH